MDTKRCPGCGEEKILTDFSNDKNRTSGKAVYCKSCVNARSRDYNRRNPEKRLENTKRWREKNRERDRANSKKWKEDNPEKVRLYRIKHTYGLSKRDYDFLLARQSGGCAICGLRPDEKKLCVDHDHETGEVRGLLCYKHNTLIALGDDDPNIFLSAIRYLTKGDPNDAGKDD